MKYCIFCLLIFTQAVKAQVSKSNTPVYVLKYYYPEDPAKIISTRACARSLNKDGSFCITDYDPNNLDKVFAIASFDRNGMPIQNGDDKIYRDSIRISFRGRDTMIRVDADKLKDP